MSCHPSLGGSVPLRDGHGDPRADGEVPDAYVGDSAVSHALLTRTLQQEMHRAVMKKSNPWALRGIAERLLEATYLELEGDLKG
jgi:cobalamin biosynthesis Mg chelatase CobN